MLNTRYHEHACFWDKGEVNISNVMDSTNMKNLVHRWYFLLCLLLCQERIPESPSPVPSLEDNHCPGSQISSHPSSSVSSSPCQMDHHSERTGKYLTQNKEFKEILSGNSSLVNRKWRKKLGSWCLLKKWLFEVAFFLLLKQYEQQNET